MKKNLAKRIVLGLLTGAVLMSSSVAWAEGELTALTHGVYKSTSYNNSFQVGTGPGNIGAANVIIVGEAGNVQGSNSVALGHNVNVFTNSTGSVALGNYAQVNGLNSVALGYGSVAEDSNLVSVGYGTAENGVGVAYRKIVNVANGDIESADSHEAVTGGQLYTVKTALVGNVSDIYGKIGLNNEGDLDLAGTYVATSSTLSGAVSALDGMVKTNYDAIDVVEDKIGNFNTFGSVGLIKDATSLSHVAYLLGNAIEKTQKVINNGTITVNNVEGAKNPVTIDSEGITVGTNSARIDGSGFYVWDSSTTGHINSEAIASMTEDGKIKGAGGKFEVGTDGQLKAANGAFKVDDNGNVTGGTYNGVDIQALANSVASNDAVAGINQRLEKTNAKINKVGAGAAALAALHPLDYDPDDKLTFSAGMGNYAGENAAALGAFYRPNEKFMLSLGGTMGNGENMVNLGLSIGLDKANGFAKMSKRELIQEVNAVKAENEAMKDQLANADERIAKLEALVAQLVAK